jgi:hypothetical protein
MPQRLADCAASVAAAKHESDCSVAEAGTRAHAPSRLLLVPRAVSETRPSAPYGITLKPTLTPAMPLNLRQLLLSIRWGNLTAIVCSIALPN